MAETTRAHVLLCYDGSVAAGAAIDAAARLLPGARASVAYLWTPPFASEGLRRRLRHRHTGLNEFVAAIEQEGEAEAIRLAGMGVALAREHGWDAEPLVHRSYGAEGLHLGQIAEQVAADVIVVGSRGLDGARAVLGSVSDVVVHYAPRPVLIVPHLLLDTEWTALDKGPVMIGWDASEGAQKARQTADRLFPDHKILSVYVSDHDEPSPNPVPGLVEIPPAHGYHDREAAVVAALTGQARNDQAALLVVGSRGQSSVREILLGSVAKAVLHQAHRPVLVVPHDFVPQPDHQL
ncbi:universal stress protein [Actinoplanes sp. NPDC026670]|uniref:universal stress protein n=1 Tax=Actinoplanes sp. NPDC026670 TaxID=3154700 RepID=UPI0033F2FE46